MYFPQVPSFLDILHFSFYKLIRLSKDLLLFVFYQIFFYQIFNLKSLSIFSVCNVSCSIKTIELIFVVKREISSNISFMDETLNKDQIVDALSYDFQTIDVDEQRSIMLLVDWMSLPIFIKFIISNIINISHIACYSLNWLSYF